MSLVCMNPVCKDQAYIGLVCMGLVCRDLVYMGLVCMSLVCKNLCLFHTDRQICTDQACMVQLYGMA